jgi:hypothetical protein
VSLLPVQVDGGRIVIPVQVGGTATGGATNLGVTRTTTSVTVTSDTGADAQIPAVGGLAGVMTPGMLDLLNLLDSVALRSSANLGDLSDANEARTNLGVDAAGTPRPPAAHTHPLGDLDQSGATAGQVPTWNGSAWAPADAGAASRTNNIRMATGLVEGASNGVTNFNTLQAQIVAAGLAGEDLCLPPGAGTKYVLATGDQGNSRNSGIRFDNTLTAGVGLRIPQGVTLEMASGQAVDGRATSLIYILSCTVPVYIGGLNGKGGRIVGNKAGQTGITGSAAANSQNQTHNLIFGEAPTGTIADVTIEDVTLDDVQSHPIWLQGDGSDTRGTCGRCTVRRVRMTRYGEAIVVTQFSDVEVVGRLAEPIQDEAHGDHWEFSGCLDVILSHLRVRPFNNGASLLSGGSAVDVYFCQRVTIDACIFDGSNNGIDAGGPPGFKADEVIVTGCIIRNVAGTFASLIAWGGRMTVADSLLYGGTAQQNYAFAANANTTGVTHVRGCTIVDANAVRIGPGAAGTFVFEDCDWYGAGPFVIRWADVNLSGGTTAKLIGINNRWHVNGATNPPEYLLQFETGGTVPAGWRFQGCVLHSSMKTVQLLAGAVDLTAVEVIGGLWGGAEPGWSATDTATVPYPLFGCNRAYLSGGTAVSALTAGHKNQVVTLRIAASQPLTHGTGNLNLSGSVDVTLGGGDAICLRFDGTGYYEEGRGGPGASFPMSLPPLPLPTWPADAKIGEVWWTHERFCSQADGSPCTTGTECATVVGSKNGRVVTFDAGKRPVFTVSGSRKYLNFAGLADYGVIASWPDPIAEVGWVGRSTFGDPDKWHNSRYATLVSYGTSGRRTHLMQPDNPVILIVDAAWKDNVALGGGNMGTGATGSGVDTPFRLHFQPTDTGADLVPGTLYMGVRDGVDSAAGGEATDREQDLIVLFNAPLTAGERAAWDAVEASVLAGTFSAGSHVDTLYGFDAAAVAQDDVTLGPGLAFTGSAGARSLNAAVSAVTVTLSQNTLDHEQVVADAAVTPVSRIAIWVAPHDDADENGPDGLDLYGVWATPGTGQFTVGLALRSPAAGPVKLHYQVGTAP